MRVVAWPAYQFWYHVSLAGLLLLVIFMCRFIYSFADIVNSLLSKILTVCIGAAFIVNCFTGWILASPKLIENMAGDVTFEYTMTWKVAILFVLSAFLIIDALRVLVLNCITNPVFRRQIEPTILGMVVIFLGNLALLVPVFHGFPVDIVCGVINAILMFYGLIRRRLFRLKFISNGMFSYTLALIATIILFSNFYDGIMTGLEALFPWMQNEYTLVFSACMVIVTLFVSSVWRALVNKIFIREEKIQQECMQEFSVTISKSIRVKDIYNAITSAIKKVTDVDGIYILMLDKAKHEYQIEHTDSDLNSSNFGLREDHPLVSYLMKSEVLVKIKEFLYSIDGKSIWEEEKEILRRNNIEYAFALKDNTNLVGIILLSNKNGKMSLGRNDTTFFEAVGSISSIAIKNSKLYEKAYKESITDELTGLYNRRNFTLKLEELFDTSKSESIVLLLLSVDDFKLYNQLYGTSEGDRALQKIARILTASVGENGYVARYSGKEFSIILPAYDILGAKSLAESISNQINKMNLNLTNYAIRKLTVSIGISAYPYAAQTMKELLENVDLAVYYVKQHGKNAIRVLDMVSALDAAGAEKEDTSLVMSVYNEYEKTIFALTAAIDTKDHYTFRHCNNVAYYATSLATALDMNEETVEIVRQAALLHDVGKIGIPEQILNKPGKLTAEEYEVIKKHVENSIGIIRHLPSLDYVIPAVLGHHEHYDGKGYPRQLSGTDIPATARILCIADSFDAIVSKRSYKEAVPLDDAIDILQKEAGKQFDPEMVTAFCRLLANGEVKIAAEESMISMDEAAATQERNILTSM